MKALAATATFNRNEEAPLYEQVREHLREHCLAQGPNTALSPVRELCELLGVNQSTVTRALRDLEADGLLRIIPRKGTFVASAPEAMVELLTMLAVEGNIGPVGQHFLAGMQQVYQGSETLSATSFVTPPFPDPDRYAQLLRLRQVAALVIGGFEYRDFPIVLDEANFIYALSKRVPVVLVGKPHSFLELDCVYCDARPQIREWLERQYANGARSFGYITSRSSVSIYRERYEEFRQFLLDHALGWNRDYIPAGDYSEWITMDSRAKLMKLIKSDPLPDAVIVHTADDAYTLVLEANRRGVEPGRDIQILCFAGAGDQLQAIAPYVTVIVIQEEETGRRAMQRIQERLSGAAEPEPQILRFPAKFLNFPPE